MATATIKRVYEIDVKQSADAAAAIRDMQRQLKDLNDGAKDLKDRFGKGLFGDLATFGFVANGFNAIKQAISSVVGSIKGISEVQADLERLRLGFATIDPRGLQGAGESIEYVRKISRQLGIDFESAASSFLKLSAASRGTAVEGQKTREIFEGISLAANRLGLSSATAENAFRAIQQMISKNVVQQEELRGQLSEALPGAIQIFARALGVSVQELNKMVQAGEVGTEAIVAFAGQLKKEFGGEIPEGVNTSILALANFKNSLLEMKQAFTDGEIGKAAASMLNTISVFFNDVSTALKAVDTGTDSIIEKMAGFAYHFIELKKYQTALTEVPRIEGEIIRLRAEIEASGKGWFNQRQQELEMNQNLLRMNKELIQSYQDVQSAKKRANTPGPTTEDRLTQAGIGFDAANPAAKGEYDRQATQFGKLTDSYKNLNKEREREFKILDTLFNSGFMERYLGSAEAARKEYDRLHAAIAKKNTVKTEEMKLAEREDKTAEGYLTRVRQMLAVEKERGKEENESMKILRLRKELEDVMEKTTSKQAKAKIADAIATLDQVDSERKLADVRVNTFKTSENLIKSYENRSTTLENENAQMEEQIKWIGKSENARREAKAAVDEQNASQLEAILRSDLERDGIEKQNAELQRLINNLRTAAKNRRDLNAAEKEDEMQRFLKQLDEKDKDREKREVEGLRDSIVSAFKNDKNLGKAIISSLQDTLEKRAFKIILEPKLDKLAEGLNELINKFVIYLNKVISNALDGSQSGGSGIGNFFGELFKGWFGGSAGNIPTGYQGNGAVFADGGKLGAGKWGIAGEEGPEWIYGGNTGMTIVPMNKSSSSGNGSNVIVNIIGAPEGTTTNETQTPDGRLIEVVIGRAKEAVASDISQGGSVASAMQGAFGLQRRTARMGF